MASIEETLHLLKNYLSVICCCSRNKHKRFSNSEPVSMGISNPVLSLDNDFQDDFIEETLNSPFKGHSMLRLEDSGFSEGQEVPPESSPKTITRNDRKDTISTRESGYGRSIEDSLTPAPEFNFKIIEIKPKLKYKIQIQDTEKCWFVYRVSMEFSYLQGFIKKRVGPLGPELRIDDIKVEDINEFVRLIFQDKELSQMTIVQEFFHTCRYGSSSSLESGMADPQQQNSTNESIVKMNLRRQHKWPAPLPPNNIRRPRSHRVPNKDSVDKPRSLNISDVPPKRREERQISPDDFDFLCVIGKGSFGKVLMARQKETRKIYAIKVLSKRMIMRKNETSHVLSERSVLIGILNHPYLVQLHFAFTSPTKIFFVLDYVNGGELFYHLQRERTFTEFRAKFYAAEICCALTYIHSKGILYRDLKPENILLDKEGHIILTDFGLCKEGLENQTSKTSTFCGTPEYLAPEIILKQPYTRSVDWWTFGAVLHEMLYGLPPFYSKNVSVMYNSIIRRDLQLKHSTSSKARLLMKQLLQKDPIRRLGSGPGDGNEVKSHEFFSKIDWKLMENRQIPPPFVPRVSSDDDLSNIDPSFTREPIGRCSSNVSNKPVSIYDYDVFEGFQYIHPDEDYGEER